MARVVIPGFRKIEVSGGGEGGTTNYNDLTNKPSINNVPLVGNLNTVDLKLTDATLTEEGVPAEAKTVGTKLEEQSTYLTALSEQLGSHTVKSDVPENAVFTDTVYVDTEVQKRISDNGYGEVAGGKNLVLNTVYGFITIDKKVNIDNSSTSYIFYAQAGKTYSFSGDVAPTADGIRVAKVSSINPKTQESVSDYIYLGDVSTFTTNETGYYMLYVYRIKIPGIKFQIEEGSVATEYEPYFPSNKMLAEEKADKSETTVNLLNPTLQTTTSNGVTCTNNGDGTYTLNGTATDTVTFVLLRDVNSIVTKYPKIYLVGCPSGGSEYNYQMYSYDKQKYASFDYGEGCIVEAAKGSVTSINIRVMSGTVCDNLVFKPMITTNLNATYDDFVPYTGSTGQINSDVASLLKRIETLESLVNKTDTTTVETE